MLKKIFFCVIYLHTTHFLCSFEIFPKAKAQTNILKAKQMDVSPRTNFISLPDARKLAKEQVLKLNVVKTKLTSVTREILSYKNLEEIDLSGNELTTLPPEFKSLTKLKKVYLRVNKLTQMPQVLFEMPQLELIDITFNKIKEIPADIEKITSLQQFYISGNQLVDLPNQLTKLTNLQVFQCAYNQIEQLPDIASLTKLKILDVSDNKLTTLPEKIGSLAKLDTLIAYSNELTQLPESLGELDNIQYLDVSKNKITSFPEKAQDAKNIKVFFVKQLDDKIPALPDAWLRIIRANYPRNDIPYLSVLFEGLNIREEREKQKIEQEKQLALVEAQKAEQARLLAQAETKSAQEAQKAAELSKRIQAEQDASRRAELERAREIAEKEREKAELERKIQEEQDAAKRKDLEEEKAKREKELKNLKEINKQKEIAEKAEKARLEKEKQFQQTLLIVFVSAMIIGGIFILYVLFANRKIKQKQKEAEEQRKKADALLLNILPAEVAEELKEKGVTEVRTFTYASILFADVKGFSALASKVTPQELIKELDHTFGKFDDVISKYGLERIKTIGDCYMCVGGVPHPDPKNVVNMVVAAVEIQNWMQEEFDARSGDFWRVRLGIHIGELVAGVIGKTKFAYDVWGHAVNTASRMESGGEVSRVNISADTYEAIKEFFVCTYRGKIEAKNIGLVDTYFVDAIKPELSVNGEGKLPNDDFFKLQKQLLLVAQG